MRNLEDASQKCVDKGSREPRQVAQNPAVSLLRYDGYTKGPSAPVPKQISHAKIVCSVRGWTH